MTDSRRSFIPPYSKLVARQHEAIGRVAAHWSLVEFMLEKILVRLAMAPDFPGLALVNDLSADNRLTALRNLAEMHLLRYGARIVPYDVIEQIKNAAPEIVRLKGLRNRIIHYVWFRANDELMTGFRFRGRQHSDTPQSLARRRKDRERNDGEWDEGHAFQLKVTSILRTADSIEALADKLFALSEALPDIDESWLGKSIRRDAHRPRRSDARSKRPAPRQSSPA